MDFTYENQGTNKYLVYAVKDSDTVDSMSLGMLTNNRIPGLAPALFVQIDSIKYVKYDISSKTPVKQLFSAQVNQKKLVGVFNSIADAILSAEEYMIDVDSMLLNLDYIFADASTCETVLVCLPVVSDGLGARDLGEFFKNVMAATQFDLTENCDYVVRILNFLNNSQVFSLTDFKKLLDEFKNSANDVDVNVLQEQPSVPEPTKQSVDPVSQTSQSSSVVEPSAECASTHIETNSEMQPEESPVNENPMQGSAVQAQAAVVPPAQQEIRQHTSTPAAQTVSQGRSDNLGETTLLNKEKVGETTVLNRASRAPIPYLLRTKNNEKITVDKPVFRIGKEKYQVDYFIGDNTAISRKHANIITREGRHFVVDINSTNHTFVNGKKLESNVETEIAHGDKIHFGNEEFEFRLQ